MSPSKLQSLCEDIKKSYTPKKGDLMFFDLTTGDDPQVLETESELALIIESMVATNKPYVIMNYKGPAPLLTLHAVNFITRENIENGKTLDVVNDGMSTEDILSLRRALRPNRNLLPY